MIKNTQINSKGFTLVETMVAISILMLAILGPLSIASSGLRNSIYARDQITAYYLAQEGIEYTRYVRDNNYLKNSSDWMEDLEFCESANGCSLDTLDFMEDYGNYLPATYSATPLKIDSDGRYTYNSGTATRYYRKIVVTPELNDERFDVSTTVTWTQGSIGTKSITLKETIYNLYAN